jgi:hypothetical protein
VVLTSKLIVGKLQDLLVHFFEQLSRLRGLWAFEGLLQYSTSVWMARELADVGGEGLRDEIGTSIESDQSLVVNCHSG